MGEPDCVVHYKDCSRYNWHDPEARCDGARCHPDPTLPDTRKVAIGINQLELLQGAIEGLLNLVVEDWTADAPIAKAPWPNSAPEVWRAIDQGIVVLGASRRWDLQLTSDPDGSASDG